MIGMERSILPQLAEVEFSIAAKTALRGRGFAYRRYSGRIRHPGQHRRGRFADGDNRNLGRLPDV